MTRYHARPVPDQTGTDSSCGAVAQLGERCVRNAEVEGSIPFRSTIPEYRRIKTPAELGVGSLMPVAV